jgi:hypothetical protein
VDTFESQWPARSIDQRACPRRLYPQRLDYDADGKLDQVIDSFGRVLDFTWDGQVVSQVVAPWRGGHFLYL